MTISVFDLFSIGIGPSSSHTVGPMRAARMFATALDESGDLDRVRHVHVELYGSLGATGHGHGSPKAVLLGLEGDDPETVDTTEGRGTGGRGAPNRSAAAGGTARDRLRLDDDLVMHRRKSLPFHPNGMTFAAHDADHRVVSERTYYSVGGGFVVDPDAHADVGAARIVPDTTEVPYPFTTGEQLLAHAEGSGLPIADLMLRNELVRRSETEIRQRLLRIWQVMQDCVVAGCSTAGVLPGGLKVPRRAPDLYAQLTADGPEGSAVGGDPLRGLDWVNLYALAVNEENAAGGRVVTAPTNGAAGIIPR